MCVLYSPRRHHQRRQYLRRNACTLCPRKSTSSLQRGDVRRKSGLDWRHTNTHIQTHRHTHTHTHTHTQRRRTDALSLSLSPLRSALGVRRRRCCCCCRSPGALWARACHSAHSIPAGDRGVVSMRRCAPVGPLTAILLSK